MPHTLTETVRTARLAAGLNLEVTGNLLGRSPDEILAWEEGRGWPTGVDLLKLCVVTGEDLGYFLGEHGPRRPVADEDVAA